MAQSEPGGSFGGCLRALREGRGSSLDEVARATRVSVRQLDALEADRLDELPAPVFVRGFIRAYCQALGESPDTALERYARVSADVSKGRRGARRRSTFAAPAPAGSSIAVSFALFAILGASLLTVNAFVRRDGDPGALPPSSTRGVIVAGAPLDPSSPAPPVVRAATAAQRLQVKALEPTWLRIQVDDARPVETLLGTGAVSEWTASRRFRLTLANAAGVAVRLNGQALPPLGARGAVIRELELPRGAPRSDAIRSSSSSSSSASSTGRPTARSASSPSSMSSRVRRSPSRTRPATERKRLTTPARLGAARAP
jgi:transcriptional regulator with XRE-family HTH domain